MPAAGSDDAIMRVEACGVCGSDPGIYSRPHVPPAVLGHEVVGEIVRIGEAASRRWRLVPGDRVAIEEYVPDWCCEWCMRGEFRLCEAAQISAPGAIRLGMAKTTQAPGLWGGFAEYMYLHPNSVLHKLSPEMPSHLAALAVPLSNGVQWAVTDGDAGAGKSVLVMGPGQQGIGAALASKCAGADLVILSGLGQDARRLEVGRMLGADVTVDVEADDLRERVMDLTRGRGVDTVVDTTGDTSGQVAATALALAARGGTVILNGKGSIPFNIAEFKKKYLTMRPVRGHSWHSIERALQIVASGRWPLEEMCSHHYGLAEVDTAIRATKGDGFPDAIHVNVNPWL